MYALEEALKRRSQEIARGLDTQMQFSLVPYLSQDLVVIAQNCRVIYKKELIELFTQLLAVETPVQAWNVVGLASISFSVQVERVLGRGVETDQATDSHVDALLGIARDGESATVLRDRIGGRG